MTHMIVRSEGGAGTTEWSRSCSFVLHHASHERLGELVKKDQFRSSKSGRTGNFKPGEHISCCCGGL